MKVEEIERILEGGIIGRDSDGEGNIVLVWEVGSGRVLFYTNKNREIVKIKFDPY